MRKKPILIALLLLAILLTIGYFVFNSPAIWEKSLDPAVAGAFITALVGLFGLWYAQWQSKSRDIAESHRPSKIEIYNTFFGIVEHIQAKVNSNKEIGEPNEWMKKEFIKLNRGLILWASPEVISAWLHFRSSAEAGKASLVAADKMYQAIRKDLGNSNFGLKTGDLLKITLKDPNEWRP